MPLFLLRHARALRLPTPADLPPLPPEVQGLAAGGTVVLSCRKGGPATVVAGLDATQRLPVPPAGDVYCHQLETDSPLAPLWLWDVAHRLPVGRTLTIADLAPAECQLLRPYFTGALREVERTSDRLVLRKEAPLPAERDAGLEAWSFCLPVGPDDATHLNATVARILSLGLPTSEILLCGRPAANFHHWDQVRIVGEDLPSRPLRLGLKKNRLAEEARHPNLCIMHDRVFLPSRFRQAVEAHGDLYPITTFQSLYCDDRWNLDARRYSDFNVILQPTTRLATGVPRASGAPSPFSPQTLASVEVSGFAAAHPRSHARDRVYVTGSLYVVKRAVWLACPQDPDIAWTEFEDVEHGLRAARYGIPAAVNPHALTQSTTQRTILSFGGAVPVLPPRGKERMRRSPFASLPLPRKPLLRQSAEAMTRNLRVFLARHAPGVSDASWATFTPRTTGGARLSVVARAAASIDLPAREQACREMIRDFERLVLGDMFPFHRTEYLVREFHQHGSEALPRLLTVPEMVSQVAQRPGAGVFAEAGEAAFPRPGLALWLGSLVTALRLRLSGRDHFAWAGGIAALHREILDTTPRAAGRAPSVRVQ
jgi:hypothetical protein